MIEYLAGVFDAEGYVRIRKNKSGNNYSYTYEARVYMCNLEIITLFSKQYNLQIKSSNRGLNKKIAYYITLNGKELRETSFISDMLPFLNEKRLQLQEIKNLIEGKKNKEQCYQDYMLAKENFHHPVIGIPTYEYLAGIIDGDGYLSFFNVGKSKKSVLNHFRIGIQQRYKPMIDYMTKFGGGNVHKCKIYDYQKHIQTYSWVSSTSDMLPLLYGIMPFLVEKKEKCIKMIEYIENYKNFKNKSDEILEWWKSQQ